MVGHGVFVSMKVSEHKCGKFFKFSLPQLSHTYVLETGLSVNKSVGLWFLLFFGIFYVLCILNETFIACLDVCHVRFKIESFPRLMQKLKMIASLFFD